MTDFISANERTGKINRLKELSMNILISLYVVVIFALLTLLLT